MKCFNEVLSVVVNIPKRFVQMIQRIDIRLSYFKPCNVIESTISVVHQPTHLTVNTCMHAGYPRELIQLKSLCRDSLSKYSLFTQTLCLYEVYSATVFAAQVNLCPRQIRLPSWSAAIDRRLYQLL